MYDEEFIIQCTGVCLAGFLEMCGVAKLTYEATTDQVDTKVDIEEEQSGTLLETPPHEVRQEFCSRQRFRI